ncbi:MAG: hypothetical protein R3194_00370 [Limnobacter sp.]|nr:hypothetical protein [Limnobacter sp.]
MLEFHDHGTYCLRLSSVSEQMLDLIDDWARMDSLPELKRLTWLTTVDESTLEHRLWPLLSNRTQRLKGLDVIAVDGRHTVGNIKDLCRLIASASPLSPGVVFVEHLENWVSQETGKLIQTDQALQIHQLNQWCRKKGLSVVALIGETLPAWSTFTHGLTELSLEGERSLTPWWLQAWGYQGGLWHFEPDTDNKQWLLDGQYYSSMGELGRDLYLLRLHADSDTGIHVRLSRWEHNSTDAVALLRLGADSVIRDLGEWKETHPRSATHLKIFDRSDLPIDKAVLDSFGPSLQEIFTPGQLKFLSAAEFSIQNMMTTRLANRWNVSCSLTRLSLLNHISATQAARLTNMLSMQCSALATSEAIYLFRVWEHKPEEEVLNEYLNTCFSVAIPSLFAGASHFLQEETIRTVLRSLSSHQAVVVSDDLSDTFVTQASSLDDVWMTADANPDRRPWIDRLASLAGISELVKGSQLNQVESR